MIGRASHVDRSLSGRELFLLELSSRQRLAFDLTLPTPCYIALLVCDGGNLSNEVLTEYLDRLLETGCCAICCWGPECERVHDLFDDTLILRWIEEHESPDPPVILSTWHDKESLTDVVEFAGMFEPISEYQEHCGCIVVITIDGGDWVREIEELFPLR